MLVTYRTAILTIEAGDGVMGEEHGFDWVNQIFDEKKKRLEQAEAERKAEALEREKYESLIDDFWTSMKRAVSSAVEVYNSHINSVTDRFRVEIPGPDSLQVRKVTIPLAGVGILLNRATQHLTCTYEQPRPVSPHDLYSIKREFDIRVAYNRLCLQDRSSTQQTAEESVIAEWILAKFFREFQDSRFSGR